MYVLTTKKKINTIKRNSILIISSIQKENIILKEKINKLQNQDYLLVKIKEYKNMIKNISEENEDWIKFGLRMEYLFKEMIRIGAIKDEHFSSWIEDLFEQNLFERPTVSESKKNFYLPSYEDADMNVPEDEEEIYRRLTLEASEYDKNIGISVSTCLNLEPYETKKKIIKIQSLFRRKIALKKIFIVRLKIFEKHIIIIQRKIRQWLNKNKKILIEKYIEPGLVIEPEPEPENLYLCQCQSCIFKRYNLTGLTENELLQRAISASLNSI